MLSGKIKTEGLCKICSAAGGKYVCPRCNVLYCSLACYQSEVHLQCSESFYRDCVVEQLKLEGSNSDSERTMLEILQKEHEEQADEEGLLDSDDEDGGDLAERLSGVDLADADAVWEKLTDSEQKAFEELLRTGDVSSLVPQWEPWWKYRKVKELVEEFGSTSTAEAPAYIEACPVVKEVPCLSSKLKCSPSPCIRWNIMNVVCAYCYLMRYFNGEPQETAKEAVAVLITLCGNLRLAHNYESLEMAVEAVIQEILKCPWLDGSSTALSTLRTDSQEVLCGPEEDRPSFYLQAALSDIHGLLELAKRDRSKETTFSKESKFYKRFADHQFSSLNPVPREKLRLYIKKIEYYLSWVKS